MDMIEPSDREKLLLNFQDIIAGNNTEMKAFHLRNSEGVRMFAPFERGPDPERKPGVRRPL